MFIRTTLGGRSTRRSVLTLLGLTLVGSLLCGGTAATAAGMPAGGPIQVFVTPNLTGNGAPDSIVITGAIGDFGTSRNMDKNGKTDPNGNYAKITLKKGTFVVNLTKLNATSNAMQPMMTAATCSAVVSAAAPVTFSDGTGLYAGIAGTVKISETFAFILPRYTTGAKKGQCNMSNSAQPLGQYGSIMGTGTVTFS